VVVTRKIREIEEGLNQAFSSNSINVRTVNVTILLEPQIKQNH